MALISLKSNNSPSNKVVSLANLDASLRKSRFQGAHRPIFVQEIRNKQ